MVRSTILAGLVGVLALVAACGSTSCRDACTHWREDCLKKDKANLQSCVDSCNLFPDTDQKQKNIDCWASTSCADIEKKPNDACGSIGPGAAF